MQASALVVALIVFFCIAPKLLKWLLALNATLIAALLVFEVASDSCVGAIGCESDPAVANCCQLEVAVGLLAFGFLVIVALGIAVGVFVNVWRTWGKGLI